MNRFNKFLASTVAGAFLLSTALLIGFQGVAQADCFAYNNGLQTSKTPVFNNICGVPTLLNSNQGQYALGNESDFVRIRSNGGDIATSSANPKLTNALTAACNNGDKFDIWNYVHNDASQDYNDLDINGNPVTPGTGSAVAHNVKLALSAPTNTKNSNFNFGGTVSASNASTVTDSATLNCGGKQVTLKLVPGTVRYNTNLSQPVYGSLGDGTVNGTTTLGNPAFGSGDVRGCWDYRTVVLYQVVVEVTPPAPEVTATCDLFSIVASDNRKVRISQFGATAKNATVKNVAINWGDNSSVLNVSSTQVVGQNHQYAADGTYSISAVVTFAVTGKADITAGGAGTACVQNVTYKTGKPPVVTPPTTTVTTTPPTTTPPTTLVNTGAGSVLSIFAAASVFGTYLYRRVLMRRIAE